MNIQLASRLAFALATCTCAAQSGWLPTTPGSQPPGRCFHAYTFDIARGVTVAFGGWNAAGPLSDTWAWNGTAWTLATRNGPPARCCHALAYDFARIETLLFGGTSGNSIDMADTWAFDGTTWTQRLPANAPSARREVRMAFDPARAGILLFGGGVGGSGIPVFGDTWSWNGVNWAQLAPATSPPPRWSQGMTHDFGRSRVVMFGGASIGTTALGDTWSWDGTNWSQLVSPVSPPAQTRTALAYDAIHYQVIGVFGQGAPGVWVLADDHWRLDARQPAPSPRETYALTADVLRGRVVLFGGGLGPLLGDVWEYVPSPFAAWTPYGVGCSGSAGTPRLAPSATDAPAIGNTFTLSSTGLPTIGIAAFSLGFSDQQWNGGALPFDLAPIGMPGCMLLARPDALVTRTITVGTASLTLAIPAAPSLVGTRFFDQAFALDPAANALGAVVSNAIAATVGAF